ncbi:MAG: hypothetical protein JNM41_04570 [Flavipsychrobacter sp.]|nr:hypothetical protein [Flavipsychrobacter sp.]
MNKKILQKKANAYKVMFLAPLIYVNSSLMFKSENRYVIAFAVCCIICCLIAAVRYLRPRRIAQHDGATLTIYGILNSLSLRTDEISSIEVEKNYLCYILDLRKVTINDKSLYTTEFDIAEFRQFIEGEGLIG